MLRSAAGGAQTLSNRLRIVCHIAVKRKRAGVHGRQRAGPRWARGPYGEVLHVSVTLNALRLPVSVVCRSRAYNSHNPSAREASSDV